MDIAIAARQRGVGGVEARRRERRDELRRALQRKGFRVDIIKGKGVEHLQDDIHGCEPQSTAYPSLSFRSEISISRIGFVHGACDRDKVWEVRS